MIHKTAMAAAACALAASAAFAAAPSGRVPQYDRYFAAQAHAAARSGTPGLSRRLSATVRDAHLGPRGIASHFDRSVGANTFLWVNNGKALAAKALAAPMKRAAQAEAVARAAIAGNASALAVGRIGMQSARLTELQDNGKGLVIARFQQRVGDHEVFNRRLAVLMDRQLTPKAISGYFAPDAQVITAKRATAAFPGSAADAIATAFAQMGGQLSPAALQLRRTAGEYAIYQRPASVGPYRLGADPRVKQVLYPDGEHLVPAYYVELAGGLFDMGVTDHYSFVIAADSGEVLFRNNQVAHEANTYEVYAAADGIHQPYDGPFGNDLEPVTQSPDGPFARVPATRNHITLEHGPIASADPWLPASAAVTTGNNVDAYVDLDDFLTDPDSNTHGDTDGFTQDGPDFRGAASSAGAFIYPYVPDSDPSTTTQRQAAIVNLFYMNNWLHDWWYHNGFDEAAGNAQLDNYGRGGVAGDPILAEAQDASSTNNANMLTPADGGSPRMQMYIFHIVDSTLTVNSPPSVAGTLEHGTAQFGPSTFDLSADLVVTEPQDACSVPGNGAALAGKIALIARGTCTFVDKIKNAQQAGAAGVIINNNVADGGPIGFAGDDDSVTIPSLGISLEDGTALRTALGGGPVNVTMHELSKTDRDGTMDNGIIAHEWFHHVSNRLVSDGNGLYNQQGGAMGEGWSDFSTLMLIVRPEDRMVPGNDHWQGVYSTGIYVDENHYFGIRRAPYSTDMAVNPLTFKHIENGVALPDSAPLAFGQGGADNAEVHASGEIWANVLWEIYASLLNDSRYTFEQAQDRMKDYVIAGLKMTPSAPTFLEARDALLAAAEATDAGDFDLMARAFAKRGMGAGAVAPGRGDDTHAGVVESFKAFGKSFVVDGTALDLAYDDGSAGYCDLDGVLDAGETARLTLSIRSTGTAAIAGPITAHLLPVAGVSYPGGDTISFTALGLLGDTLTGTALIKLDAASIGQPLSLQIEFPQIGGDAGDVDEPQTEEIDLATNYDLMPEAASDNMEQPLTSQHDWQVTAPSANLPSWQIRDGSELDVEGTPFASGKLWYAADNDGASDLSLTTPPLHVGSSEFTFSFTHYYQMELAGYLDDNTPVGYDGGVIEISVDDGEWQDALESPDYPVTISKGSGYNGLALVFDPDNGRAAFVDVNANGYEPVTLSYGTALAGHTVRLRFREVSDEAAGEFGWVVDDVSFTGLDQPPFSKVIADAATCANRPPHADAGADLTVKGAKKHKQRGQQLQGVVHDRDGDAGLSYAWTQVSGEPVTITDAATLTPTIELPHVSAPTDLVFRLTASDGSASSSDDVKLTVTEAKSGGGGAMGLGLLLLVPLAMLRRRRKLH